MPGDDLAGFARWVSHFAEGWSPRAGDYYGYNPLNMMARTLTCTDERWNCDYLKECEAPCAHHVGQRAADATPPLAEALAVVHTADFIGVLELLPESLCLVEYRKTGRLPPHCVCASEGGGGAAAAAAAAGGGKRGGKRVAHVMNSRKQRASRKVSVGEAPPEVLRQLDAVTRIDALVYRAAVLRVLCDVRALELATGSRVLCAPRVAALRNKTAYIPGLWDGTAAASAVEDWADARKAYSSDQR